MMLRHNCDGQSALNVLSPEKIYQSNNKLIAEIIRNTFKKPLPCMSIGINLQFKKRIVIKIKRPVLRLWHY